MDGIVAPSLTDVLSIGKALNSGANCAPSQPAVVSTVAPASNDPAAQRCACGNAAAWCILLERPTSAVAQHVHECTSCRERRGESAKYGTGATIVDRFDVSFHRAVVAGVEGGRRARA